MGRVVLLGLCPNSLHKAEVWDCALGLRYGPVHVLFSDPINIYKKNLNLFLIQRSMKNNYTYKIITYQTLEQSLC